MLVEELKKELRVAPRFNFARSVGRRRLELTTPVQILILSVTWQSAKAKASASTSLTSTSQTL